MKKTKNLCGLLAASLILGGCGANAEGTEAAEAAAFNFWPWLLGLLGLVLLGLAVYQTYCYVVYLRKARRRRRKNTHGVEPVTFILYGAAVVFLLLALLSGILSGGEPADPTGDTTTEPSTTADTTPLTGWVEEGGSRFYMHADGTFATGWMDLDGKRYYFQDDGTTLSGWHEVEGINRYFRPDGSMARGENDINGEKYYFSSTGAEVLMADPVPTDYTVELVELSNLYATEGVQVDARIYDDLIAMMDACNEAAPRCCVISGYWDRETQEWMFNSRVSALMDEGYDQAQAEAQAAMSVARPGYSEYEMGLVVDIVDTRSWSLNEDQEDLPAQQWLMEHSWEYGFILRYPEGKSEATGMTYKPWHYRYVGRELAKELHDTGLTLEEYLENLD